MTDYEFAKKYDAVLVAWVKSGLMIPFLAFITWAAWNLIDLPSSLGGTFWAGEPWFHSFLEQDMRVLQARSMTLFLAVLIAGLAFIRFNEGYMEALIVCEAVRPQYPKNWHVYPVKTVVDGCPTWKVAVEEPEGSNWKQLETGWHW